MKGKLMIALVILALVFGFVLASCDDGAFPKKSSSDDGKELVIDDQLLQMKYTAIEDAGMLDSVKEAVKSGEIDFSGEPSGPGEGDDD